MDTENWKKKNRSCCRGNSLCKSLPPSTIGYKLLWALKTNHLILYRKIITFGSVIHKNYSNTICECNIDLLCYLVLYKVNTGPSSFKELIDGLSNTAPFLGHIHIFL